MPDSSGQVAGLVAGLTEKDATAVDTFLERLKLATNAKSDSDLARLMGLRQSAMSSAKSRGQIPAAWLVNISIHYKISADWLLTGEGAMHRGAIEQELPQGPLETDEPCTRCERLEADNRELVRDNRELVSDNRELVKENRELMRENGDLRVELAELKAVIPTDTHRRKAG